MAGPGASLGARLGRTLRAPSPNQTRRAAQRPGEGAIRRAAAGLGVAIGTGALGFLATAWHYAQDLLDPARSGDPYTLKVLAVDGESVTLPANDDTLRPGRCSLQWPGGYGLLGEICERTPTPSEAPGGDAPEPAERTSPSEAPGGDRPEPAERTKRIRRTLAGRVGTALGADVRARIKRHAHEGDPGQALGLAFDEVHVPGPLGPMPAWLVPAPPSGRGEGSPRVDQPSWAVLVHGRGSIRPALLRLVRETHALGLTSLVITYRNDAGAPAGPDGLYHLGDTEWLDLEAAVGEALRRGAGHIVLFGDSMGGAIVLQFLDRSALAGAARAVVLDSPVLDWGPVLALAAEQRRLPPLLTAVAKQIVRLRTGLRWERFDQVQRAGELTVPILLIHGDADTTVPVTTSDALAARRPDLVTYVRVPGAGHAESWTIDRPRCAKALGRFLGALS